jgi:hypothetical protein
MKLFKTKCRECGLIIEGTAPTQVAFNLELHLQKHARDKKKEAKQ